MMHDYQHCPNYYRRAHGGVYHRMIRRLRNNSRWNTRLRANGMLRRKTCRQQADKQKHNVASHGYILLQVVHQ